MSIGEQIDGSELLELIEELEATRLPPKEERRQIRLRAGVSARRAAKAIPVAPMTLLKWEDGATPNPEHAVAYRRLLEALERVAAA